VTQDDAEQRRGWYHVQDLLRKLGVLANMVASQRADGSSTAEKNVGQQMTCEQVERLLGYKYVQAPRLASYVLSDAERPLQ
jgi:hypothetical protein